MDHLTSSVTQIALAIVGVAILAVIVSKKSNTAAVIQSMASGFGNSLGVAISPVTGADIKYHLEYPGSGGYAF